MDENFHKILKRKMDEYVHLVYKITRNFPKEELYGVTSQLRRSALSVILNYIEGYARRRPAVLKNSLEVSYGSLKESEYLLIFSKKENYIIDEVFYRQSLALADEIGGMLWRTIENIKL